MATTITFPGPGGEAHPATTAALHFVGPKGLAVATNPAGTTVVLTQGEAGFTLFGDVAVARHVCKLGGAYGVDADGQSLVRASWVVFGGLHPAPPPSIIIAILTEWWRSTWLEVGVLGSRVVAVPCATWACVWFVLGGGKNVNLGSPLYLCQCDAPTVACTPHPSVLYTWYYIKLVRVHGAR
jgi:hypothetical protein